MCCNGPGHPCRYKKECSEVKEENRRVRQDQAEASREKERLRSEVEQLLREVTKLNRYKSEYAVLLESHRSLEEEVGILSDHYKSILEEKAGLEDQTRETIQALNEEREAKDILERKLKDTSLRSQSPSWAEEVVGSLHNGRSSPTSSPSFHSTPSRAPIPSLLNDLHDSIVEQLDPEALKRKVKKAEEMVGVLQKEKQSLEERLAGYLAEHEAEVSRLKEMGSEQVKEVKAMREAASMREELVEQLKAKLGTSSAERARLEIDLEEQKEELNRLKKDARAEVEKTQLECTQEQNKNAELRARAAQLEQQVAEYAGTTQRLEGALYATHCELATMTEDMRSMQKAIVTLCSDSRLGGRSLTSRDMTPASPEPPSGDGEGEDQQRASSNNGGGAQRFTPLELRQSKVTIQVHGESHTLMALVQLHDQLRSLRLPLEQFTRIMLERSLAHSVKHGAEVTQSVPAGGNNSSSGGSVMRSPAEVEAIISKWKAKVANKTEEVSNLRAIMKARVTTSEVANSTLKSKLEGQERTYQAELARLKFQIKSLKKERDESGSLKTMYAQRCEDYIDEMGRLKKEIHGLQMENEELLMSLKKTIQKKLDLSTQLEEYQIEKERVHHIPKLLLASRV